MTIAELKAQLDAIPPERVQRLRIGCGQGWVDCTRTDPPLWDFINWEYREKPAPAKRLIRLDELPAVCWVREDPATRIEEARLVTARYPHLSGGSIEFSYTVRTLANLAEARWQWSEDCKHWYSFEVEAS